jgi:hypothetical protein
VTDPTPTPLRKIHLELDTFTGAEAMALQREFECDWTDLVAVVAGKVSARTRGQTDGKLLDSRKRVRFANEVLSWMIWTVYRRDDPGAELAPLLDLLWGDLVKLLEPIDPKAVSGKRSTRTT